jgi:transcription initiation factor TFIID TATA-box-binding protein
LHQNFFQKNVFEFDENTNNKFSKMSSSAVEWNKPGERQLTTDPEILAEINQLNLELQNVVATVKLSTKLDPMTIFRNLQIAYYNPSRFAAVVCRMKTTKSTALIFESGKMVCTGAKSEEDSMIAVRKYLFLLRKLGYEFTYKYTLQNMVAVCNIRFEVDIDKLIKTLGNLCSYVPEMFPGVKYKLKKPRVTMLLFATGMIVFTGATHYGQIVEAMYHIYEIMRMHKKPLSILPPTEDAISILQRAEDAMDTQA